MLNNILKSLDIKKIILFLSSVAMISYYRVIPHPANFSPALSMLIFLSSILGNKAGYSAIVLGLLLSDLSLETEEHQYFLYLFYALPALLSSRFLNFNLLMNNFSKIEITKYARSSTNIVLTSSLLFFVFSNLFVFLTGNLYTMNFEGLILCYYMALPFFKVSLIGDLVFTSIFLTAVMGYGVFTNKIYLKNLTN